MLLPFRASPFIIGVIFASAIGTSADAASTQVSGQLELDVRVKVNPAIPDGTAASIYASASDSSFANSSYAYPPSVTVEGGMIETSIPITYDWTVPSTSETMTISVAISGVDVSYSASMNHNQTIALPKNGAVTKLSFDDAF